MKQTQRTPRLTARFLLRQACVTSCAIYKVVSPQGTGFILEREMSLKKILNTTISESNNVFSHLPTLPIIVKSNEVSASTTKRFVKSC